MDADNKKVIDLVGRSRICAIVSDSTGNTRLHRELLVDEIPTMFNLPDIVHFISNLIKDIVKIDYFKNTITIMRGVIAKFHKSHLGATELEFAHVECGIKRGLTTIGRTRFGTIILAAWSLQHNLPALKRVVERNNFDLGVRYFLNLFQYSNNQLFLKRNLRHTFDKRLELQMSSSSVSLSLLDWVLQR